jgi:Na+/melibiose symporter-like transporter
MLIVDTTTRRPGRPERLLPVLIYSVSVFAISATMFWDTSPQKDTTMKQFWYIPIYINATTFLVCVWTLIAYIQSRLKSLNVVTESSRPGGLEEGKLSPKS